MEDEDRHAFGQKGLLRKRKERKSQMTASGGQITGISKKRKFADAGEAISSFAKTQRSAQGQNAFKKALKRR